MISLYRRILFLFIINYLSCVSSLKPLRRKHTKRATTAARSMQIMKDFNKFKTNTPTSAPVYNIWNNLYQEGRKVTLGMSILFENGIVHDVENHQFSAKEDETILSEDQVVSVLYNTASSICKTTNYHVIYSENEIFYDYCNSNAEYDIHNPDIDATVLYADFENELGLLNIEDRSVYIASSEEPDETMFLGWKVWKITYLVLQLSVEDTIESVEEKVNTFNPQFLNSFPSNVQQVVAVSNIGSEVQDFTKAVRYANGEMNIISEEENDQTFWIGVRIAGFALGGFLFVVLGSLWYSVRRRKKHEILNASTIQEFGADLDLDTNEEDLSFLSSEAERSQGVCSTSDDSGKMVAMLPHSRLNDNRVRDEWVSIQITPKQTS